MAALLGLSACSPAIVETPAPTSSNSPALVEPPTPVSSHPALSETSAPGSDDARDGQSELPLPRSIEVRVQGAYVRTSASPRGSRRGTLSFGARLRPLESKRASGCEREWYRIGREAWICGESVARRGTEPNARSLPVVDEGELVPYSYGFAREDGARLYRTLADAEYGEWERDLDPRSGLHIRSKVKHGGTHYYRMAKRGYVPVGDVRPARPSRFSGVQLESGQTAAFVKRGAVRVRPNPGRGRVLRRLGRRAGMAVLETSMLGRALWLRIGESEWVNGPNIIRSQPVPPPPPVGESGRWIHVDRARQLLTAYEGPRPVFATMVSTGRRGAATPAGTFRIWAKLATGTMSDEGETIDDNPYEMRGVPWVMYFNEGVALHGVYWHNDFGRRRSHGCVNLAPTDAAFLFNWTSPQLPPGWLGVLPTRSDPGTLIVVN